MEPREAHRLHVIHCVGCSEYYGHAGPRPIPTGPDPGRRFEGGAPSAVAIMGLLIFMQAVALVAFFLLVR